jgi:hypothetical protein
MVGNQHTDNAVLSAEGFVNHTIRSAPMPAIQPRFFGSKPDAAEADATFMKKSPTEYVIDGPTYLENGTEVTEHHDCHKV